MLLPWAPLMLLVFAWFPDMSEFLIASVELVLDVPIQVDLTFGETNVLNLNDDDVIIPFRNRLFVEARSFVENMLDEGKITLDNVRPRARMMFA